MFRFMLALSALYRTVKYIIGVPVTFAMAGLPLAWCLLQRYRLKTYAPKAGWKYIPSESSSKSPIIKKSIDGYNVEIWPSDSFGAKVFVYFKHRRKLDLDPGRPGSRAKKIEDFTTASKNFNALFYTMRGGRREIAGLQNSPDALDAVVRFRANWMFSGGDLLITENYLLLYMTYGTPIGYYLPPGVLESLSLDAVKTTARFESAFK
ncbi:MAG: hypothetical protein JXR91_05905 [Deltaproteobacteria bacterium]|nr:hypothetical protein [Deltaproteobacteria bacterium]